MSSTCYAYDMQTGEFRGTVEKTPDPLEPGRLVAPAFTTDAVPPQVSGQAAAVFRGSAWSTVPDHRGQIWFKGRDPVPVTDLGDPTALGLSQTQAPDPEPVPSTICTRLGLKRAFAERGTWPMVRAMIASDPDMQEEWDLATTLQMSDPIVQHAIGGLARLGIAMTPDDVRTLIMRANELVQ